MENILKYSEFIAESNNTTEDTQVIEKKENKKCECGKDDCKECNPKDGKKPECNCNKDKKEDDKKVEETLSFDEFVTAKENSDTTTTESTENPDEIKTFESFTK